MGALRYSSATDVASTAAHRTEMPRSTSDGDFLVLITAEPSGFMPSATGSMSSSDSSRMTSMSGR